MRPVHPGTTHTVEVVVEDRFTVPGLMPAIRSWAAMPAVLATAMLVAFMEWAALELLLPFQEGAERTVGISIDAIHVAPTPAGATVRVTATLVRRTGRFADFEIVARDDADVIGRATHRRAVIDKSRFEARAGRRR